MQALSIISAILSADNSQTKPAEERENSSAKIDITMEYLSLDQVKQIELDIWKYVDAVCKEYNLRYFLSFGTLIGAIRHKGFIPWDDDIDISMPREDYERFVEIKKCQRDRSVASA